MQSNLNKCNMEGCNLSYTNLSYANLSYANMTEAKLTKTLLVSTRMDGLKLDSTDLNTIAFSGSDGNLKEIKSIRVSTFKVSYTHDRMTIAGVTLPIKEWKQMDYNKIEKMKKMGKVEADFALFWSKTQDYILSSVKSFPATKPADDQ